MDELEPEPPGANVPRFLFSLILMVDLLIVLGPLALILVGGFIVLAMLMAMLGMGWVITIFGFLLQSVFYFLSPLIGGLMGSNRDRRLQRVTNYIVRTDRGQTRTFRIKGQLQGATVAEGDRVRVEGRRRHGILMFQRGEKLDTGEQLTLPFNWAWLLLVLAIVANVILYATISGEL